MVRTTDSHRAQSAARYAMPLRQDGAELSPANPVDFRHANLRLGIDVGSTTVKLAVIDANDNLVYANYERHHTDIRATARQLFERAQRVLGGARMRVSITGSGGMLLAKWLDLEFVQEVIASKRAVETLIPTQSQAAAASSPSLTFSRCSTRARHQPTLPAPCCRRWPTRRSLAWHVVTPFVATWPSSVVRCSTCRNCASASTRRLTSTRSIVSFPRTRTCLWLLAQRLLARRRRPSPLRKSSTRLPTSRIRRAQRSRVLTRSLPLTRTTMPSSVVMTRRSSRAATSVTIAAVCSSASMRVLQP